MIWKIDFRLEERKELGCNRIPFFVPDCMQNRSRNAQFYIHLNHPEPRKMPEIAHFCVFVQFFDFSLKHLKINKLQRKMYVKPCNEMKNPYIRVYENKSCIHFKGGFYIQFRCFWCFFTITINVASMLFVSNIVCVNVKVASKFCVIASNLIPFFSFNRKGIFQLQRYNPHPLC